MLAVESVGNDPMIDWNTAVAVISIGVRLFCGTQRVALLVIEIEEVAVPGMPFASV